MQLSTRSDPGHQERYFDMPYYLEPLKTILQAPKHYRACVAADIMAGRFALPPTVDVLAKIYEISACSIRRAAQLSDDERAAVCRGERPLVLPRPESPAKQLDGNTAKHRVAQIVAAIGLEATFNLLAEHEAAWWHPREMQDVA
jgi:hypothetical protein